MFSTLFYRDTYLPLCYYFSLCFKAKPSVFPNSTIFRRAALVKRIIEKQHTKKNKSCHNLLAEATDRLSLLRRISRDSLYSSVLLNSSWQAFSGDEPVRAHYHAYLKSLKIIFPQYSTACAVLKSQEIPYVISEAVAFYFGGDCVQ